MRLLGLLLVVMLLSVPAWGVQNVANTVHNLSSSGPGLIKSDTIDEICVFCHTPHNAVPAAPLWNHTLSGQTYSMYGTTTMDADIPVDAQPTGRSRLCLSCHDGTVALGALGNMPNGQVNDLLDTRLAGRANLGTDLVDDHPISFRYDVQLSQQDGKLTNPQLPTFDLPLENAELQCTSCHDPHEKDIVPFLHKSTLNGELCVTCHAQAGAGWSWAASSHATSPAQPTLGNPWAERKAEWRGATVAENACFNCHTPHNSVSPPNPVTPQPLIKGLEEDTCFLCHNGTVAATDIQSELGKAYTHPVTLYSGVHDPAEDFGLSPPNEHVECPDCHNPHGAGSGGGQRPAVPASDAGVPGIDSGSGLKLQEASNLYEICYKCHADNNVVTALRVNRYAVEMNTRREFNLGNPSYHPVEGIGQNPDVPSLITPPGMPTLTEQSVIYCIDCHNNNSLTGPRGPHGSIFESLLERNYTTADNTPFSTLAYDLCFKCHDWDILRSNNSGFPEHDKHIRGDDVPCAACHDAHGSSINTHLINFDSTIVSPRGGNPEPIFTDLGNARGECDLLCHGVSHDPVDFNYQR